MPLGSVQELQLVMTDQDNPARRFGEREDMAADDMFKVAFGTVYFTAKARRTQRFFLLFLAFFASLR